MSLSTFFAFGFKITLWDLVITATLKALLIWLQPGLHLILIQQFEISALVEVMLYSVAEGAVLCWFLLLDCCSTCRFTLLTTMQDSSKSLNWFEVPLLVSLWLRVDSAYITSILCLILLYSELVFKPVAKFYQCWNWDLNGVDKPSEVCFKIMRQFGKKTWNMRPTFEFCPSFSSKLVQHSN